MWILKNAVILSLGLLLTGLLAAQGQSEVFAFDYQDGKKKWKVGNAQLLTYDNKMGYNNQPTFVEDWIYITQSSNLNGKNQTDIVAFDTQLKLKTRVTKTESSEYSPSPSPDGKHFTVVEAGKGGKQQLVQYRLDRKGEGKVLFKDKDNVGYHCWLSDDKVALFLVEESKGNRLAIGDVKTGSIKHVAFNIGRCIKSSPNGSLIYLDQSEPSSRKLKSHNPETGQSVFLGEMLGEGEDFEVLPNGYVITGHEGRLHRLEPEKGKAWLELCSLRPFIKNKKISRIAATGSRLAVVVND